MTVTEGQARPQYLFGDSTPFPLEENFLETACSASQAAVALLRAHEIRVIERRLVSEVELRMRSELAHLEKLSRRVNETYAEPVDDLRVHIGGVAKEMVVEMRAEVQRWRDTAIAAALATGALKSVLPAIGSFFERHQLPGTEWSVAWRARLDGTSQAAAQVFARAPGGLDVSFDVKMPLEHGWARAPRVHTVDRGVAIRLMKKRVLRKPRIEVESLDSLFVTEAIDLPGESTLTLRRSSKKPSPGVRIVLPCESSPVTQVARIAEDGSRVGDPEVMGPEDAAVLRRLFASIGASMRSLTPYRSKLRAAYFRDLPVADVEQPGAIAELMVESVAALVREIARRSNGRDELALKRTLGDGRREELFVPYATILAGVDDLEIDHRSIFEAYDLGDGSTLVRPLLPLPRAPQPHLLGRLPMPSDATTTQERPALHLASA